MWDIDGLFNNRLLQIEQLVRRSELYTRDTLARIREEAECVCVHLGRAGENKREKETKHLKKKKVETRVHHLMEGVQLAAVQHRSVCRRRGRH